MVMEDLPIPENEERRKAVRSISNRHSGLIFKLKGDQFSEAKKILQILRNDIRADNPGIKTEFDIDDRGNTTVAVLDIRQQDARKLLQKVKDNNVGFDHDILEFR